MKTFGPKKWSWNVVLFEFDSHIWSDFKKYSGSYFNSKIKLNQPVTDYKNSSISFAQKND